MVNLTDTIKSRKAMELLEYIIENQDQEFYLAELTKKTKISKNTLSKWLNNFMKNKVLEAKVIGKTKSYKARKTHPVFKQLKIFLAVTKIWDIVKELEGKVEIYIYGSVAVGEDDQKSDLDLLILGRIEKEELLNLVKKINKAIKREVKPLVLTPLEYAELARYDRILYGNIEKSKIRLI